jgi:SAM-dependent methyltransferase
MKIYRYITRLNCPVCDCSESLTLYKESFAKGATFSFIKDYYNHRISKKQLRIGFYELVRCSNCTLIFQKHIPDKKSLEDIYERAINKYDSLNKREHASSGYFRSLLISASTVNYFIHKSRARDIKVLDFGMGWGHWALAAKALGFNVEGAELSKSRIKFAKLQGLKIVNPFNNDRNKYDFINTDQVFEHLDKPFETLSQLSKSLNPNGIIKIFVPNANHDYRSLKSGEWLPRKDSFHPLEHLNGFNSKSLNILAKRCNLFPVRITNLSSRSFFKLLRQQIKHFTGAPSWYFYKKI